MRTLRRIVQLVALLLFLVLLTKTSYPLSMEGWVDIFPRLSPVAVLFTMISSRTILSRILPALILLILTLLLGRFFCGWICPLGSTIDISDRLFFGRIGSGRKTGYQRLKITPAIKYYFLAFLLVGSVLGLQIAGWFDPLSLITRSYALVFLPYLNFMGSNIFNLLQRIPLITHISEPVYSFLRIHLFYSLPPLFSHHLLLLVLFAAVLSLGFLSRRGWCRLLCPLGALLALVSRYSPLRRMVREDCESCRICETGCKMGAITDHGKGILAGECIECLTCIGICPSGEVSFRFEISRQKALQRSVSLSRRGLLIGGMGGIVALPVLSLSHPRREESIYLVRPPGALPEDEFVTRCIRCGECMKVCPTSGLQPSLWQAGLQGFLTPVLVPRVGYCEYNCRLCTQVCPTGAIQRISLELKRRFRIGTAHIDKTRCIPYAQGKNCVVCEEVCPIPTKAVKLREAKPGDMIGRGVAIVEEPLLLPYILEEICIGCGICEYKCPVEGKAAITVSIPNVLGPKDEPAHPRLLSLEALPRPEQDRL